MAWRNRVKYMSSKIETSQYFYTVCSAVMVKDMTVEKGDGSWNDRDSGGQILILR